MLLLLYNHGGGSGGSGGNGHGGDGCNSGGGWQGGGSGRGGEGMHGYSHDIFRNAMPILPGLMLDIDNLLALRLNAQKKRAFDKASAIHGVLSNVHDICM